MSCVAVIIYSVYLISSRDKKKIPKYILVLFIIIVFLKSSATLLAGMMFSILAIFILEYKKLSKYNIFSYILLLIILFTVFATDDVCRNKIAMSNEDKIHFDNLNPLSKENTTTNLLFEINQLIIDNKKSVIDIDVKEKFIKRLNKLLSDQSLSPEVKVEIIKIKQLLVTSNNNKNLFLEIDKTKENLVKIKNKDLNLKRNYRGSLSSDVFYHALKVTYESFFIKPFGWGFQGYELAFNNYNNRNNIFKQSLKKYNNKDASNNTFKIITEFGIFSVIIFLFLLYISLSQKISLENKIFLIPFLITQFIRGAGYFNGAFILIIFLLIVLQFKNINKESI
jgi:hypothetical protein